MTRLLIAIGNQLRRDDGVAHRVLELLDPPEETTLVSCHQLTPEMAVDLAGAAAVVFIDADAGAVVPRLEHIPASSSSAASLTHTLSPAGLVALAEGLDSFHGHAWLCRVPGVDFGEGEGLSDIAEAGAHSAVALLRDFLR